MTLKPHLNGQRDEPARRRQRQIDVQAAVAEESQVVMDESKLSPAPKRSGSPGRRAFGESGRREPALFGIKAFSRGAIRQSVWAKEKTEKQNTNYSLFSPVVCMFRETERTQSLRTGSSWRGKIASYQQR